MYILAIYVSGNIVRDIYLLFTYFQTYMKKIEDYLHLYLGCKVMEVGDNQGMLSGIIEKRVLIDCSSNASYWTSIVNIKPILRPLSDMTEEEAKEFAAIEGLVNVTIRRNLDYAHVEITDDSYTMCILYDKIELSKNGQLCRISKVFELTRYLLSKHFDLFDLIPAGLAIDKTKL